jgi:septum formation protein
VIDFDRRGPFRPALPLVLASASPRRQRLLASLGLSFEVVPSPFEEPMPSQGQDPAEYALATATLKGNAIAQARPDAVVLAADTIVVLKNPLRILGKPRDHAEAVAMLEQLCTGPHKVITGCALFLPGGASRTYCSTTDVVMDAPAPGALEAYARTGEPMDKAGAYAIQGIGGFLVREIRGSSTNVIGLPLNETVHALLEAGAIRLAG